MEERDFSKEWLFSFNGRYGDYILKKSEVFPPQLLEEMTRSREEITQEIKIEVSQSLRFEVAVQIEFREGSLEWIGTINSYNDALAVAANVGGTIALLQLIGSAISRALRKFMPISLPHPVTEVMLMAAPVVTPNPKAQAVPVASEIPGKAFDSRDVLFLTLGLVNLSLAVLITMVAIRVFRIL